MEREQVLEGAKWGARRSLADVHLADTEDEDGEGRYEEKKGAHSACTKWEP